MNFTFRMYDPRIARFFTVDPLTKKYPHYTPYSFSGNKVVDHAELEGLEEINVINVWTDGYGVQQTKSSHTEINDEVEGTFSLFRHFNDKGEIYAITWNQTYHRVKGSRVYELFVGSWKDEQRRKAKQEIVYGKPERKKPGKDITGNYVLDAWVHILGGNIVIDAFNGDQKAKEQLILNWPFYVMPSGRSGIRTGTILNPKLIRYSQKTMNGSKFDKIVKSMQLKGWDGDAIDIVKMVDNMYTSLDNKRLAAAQKTGINAQVNIYNFDDAFPEQRALQFEKQYGVKPKTYGEAVKLRINGQGAEFRNTNPNGSTEQPKANYPEPKE